MKKRTFKHYLLIYAVSFAVVLLFAVVAYSRKFEDGSYGYLVSSNIPVSGAFASEFNMFGRPVVVGLFLIDLAVMLVFPLVVCLVFFLMDLGRGRAGKKTKEEINRESFEKFIDEIGRTLNQTHLFNVEDFRHFRENDKFQDCLKKIYEIYVHGETEELTYYSIIRKFQKGTKERDALEFLVTFGEKKRLEAIKLEEEKKKELEAKESEKEETKDKEEEKK
ncbi:MAG: hypothetical protein K6F59_03030 [Gammaproteobacteria bacterium]|nr:hypothetical protein [Gammaproteobacteria bacterium]